jgi:hypothetical protein
MHFSRSPPNPETLRLRPWEIKRNAVLRAEGEFLSAEADSE